MIPDWNMCHPVTALTANPAAGAQIADVVVPAGERWLFLGCEFSCVNAAAAATRTPQLLILPDGTNEALRYQDATGAIISETFKCSFSPGAQSSTAGATPNKSNVVGIGIGIVLDVGAIIRVNLLNIQGADDMTALAYYYLRLPV